MICRPKYPQNFPLSRPKQKIRQKIKKVNAKKVLQSMPLAVLKYVFEIIQRPGNSSS